MPKNSKIQTVATIQDIDNLRSRIKISASRASGALSELLSGRDAIDFLKKVRFDPVGFDPLDENRPLNFTEQLNQTFTYLVSLKAAEYLIEKYPDKAPFTLNLGTTLGPDILSHDESIVAETFAATRPDSNSKLKNDINNLSGYHAELKFVFYYSPIKVYGQYKRDEVIIVPLKDVI